MLLLSQIIVVLSSALVFWHWVQIDYLLRVLPTMVPAISILLAAVFVRLNRGLPSIDWKVMTVEARSRLATEFLRLSHEYAGVLALGTTVLLMIIALGGIAPATLQAWPLRWQHGLSSGVGLVLGLLLVRMGYVVWRDVDIVRLQKQVIDAIPLYEAREAEKTAQAAATAAALRRESQAAADKRAAIERTPLRTEPTKVSSL